MPELVSSNYALIFAECKTFNDFQKKDVDRMKDLGKSFPGSVLVFAKLGESLDDDEKMILRPLVNRSRKSRKNDRPFNPVLILTGTELFWKSDLSEWRRKMQEKIKVIRPPSGPQTELHQFCDLTQQIYLDIDS